MKEEMKNIVEELAGTTPMIQPSQNFPNRTIVWLYFDDPDQKKMTKIFDRFAKVCRDKSVRAYLSPRDDGKFVLELTIDGEYSFCFHRRVDIADAFLNHIQVNYAKQDFELRIRMIRNLNYEGSPVSHCYVDIQKLEFMISLRKKYA